MLKLKLIQVVRLLGWPLFEIFKKEERLSLQRILNIEEQTFDRYSIQEEP